MQTLSITTIQTHLYWEDAEKNLEHFSSKINEILYPTDVIVLPEMFTTGFTMNPEKLAEETTGKGLAWMIEIAQQKHSLIIGSISVKEQSNYYNRLYCVKPDGSFSYYDKRHLFRMGNEQQHYTAGTEKIIVEYKGWRICPLVCYDLRFPVWSRNNSENPYDILIYVANWPEVRNYPWKQLLIARAIENQSYVVGVNRVGLDGNGVAHSGDSCIINAKGEMLNIMDAHQDSIETTNISFDVLSEYRKLFPVLLDADSFTVQVS